MHVLILSKWSIHNFISAGHSRLFSEGQNHPRFGWTKIRFYPLSFKLSWEINGVQLLLFQIMAIAVSMVASAGARVLAQALPRASLSTRRSCSKSDFNPMQLRRIVRIQYPPTRKSLIVRAARTEPQGVSLGFRAPHFEVLPHYYK